MHCREPKTSIVGDVAADSAVFTKWDSATAPASAPSTTAVVSLVSVGSDKNSSPEFIKLSHGISKEELKQRIYY